MHSLEKPALLRDTLGGLRYKTSVAPKKHALLMRPRALLMRPRALLMRPRASSCVSVRYSCVPVRPHASPCVLMHPLEGTKEEAPLPPFSFVEQALTPRDESYKRHFWCICSHLEG